MNRIRQAKEELYMHAAYRDGHRWKSVELNSTMSKQSKSMVLEGFRRLAFKMLQNSLFQEHIIIVYYCNCLMSYQPKFCLVIYEPYGIKLGMIYCSCDFPHFRPKGSVVFCWRGICEPAYWYGASMYWTNCSILHLNWFGNVKGLAKSATGPMYD